MGMLSSGLKMFGRNEAIAKRIAAGAGRASGAMGAMSYKAGVRGAMRTNKVLSAGARGLDYAARYPRRAGAAVGISAGALGLMGNGRRNNSTYQQSNPYNY